MNTALSCLSFQNVSFDVVDRSGQPWLRSQQISVALGYGRSDQVNDLYARNADEFTDAMTALVPLQTPGGIQEVRIFSLRGCHLLGMFARTDTAKDFRKWVLDVLDHQTSALPVTPALPVMESSLVLACGEVPVRFLIDETGEWMATYKDVAATLGFVNKEQQYSARNVLKYTVKAGERQLRHPLYGDLVSLAGIHRMVAQFERNAACMPERAQAARALREWLTTVAAPLVAQPASAGMLLAQQRPLPAGQLALAYDPDYQQTATLLAIWHQTLGEAFYLASEIVKSASGELAEALREVAKQRWFSTAPNAKRLGKWLSLRQGQVVDGLRIVSTADRSRKVRVWAVQA